MDMRDDSILFDGSPLDSFIAFQVSNLNMALNIQSTAIIKQLSTLSLTEWRVVSLIGSEPRSTSGYLCKKANMDKGLFSRRLKNLASEGYVAMCEDKEDHRLQHLRLTDKGQEVYDRVLPAMMKRQAYLENTLNEQELASLFDILERLETAVANSMDQSKCTVCEDVAD